MKLVVQRVTQAKVTVDSTVVGSIGQGYMVLFGAVADDTTEQVDWLVQKLCKLKLFTDNSGKKDSLTIHDIQGEILVVSQFTLAGRIEKGNRPDYSRALHPDKAKVLYERFVAMLRETGLTVATGTFGAQMQVELTNNGPKTLILER